MNEQEHGEGNRAPMGSAHAVDPIFHEHVRISRSFGAENEARRGLNSFLEVGRFILTEYEHVGRHGDTEYELSPDPVVHGWLCGWSNCSGSGVNARSPLN